MMSHRWLLICLAALGVHFAAQAGAQSPSVLYTWNGTGDIREWKKNFGTNDVLLDNAIAGQLRIIEIGATAGEDVAISDGSNRILEAPNSGSGGLDLTGLEFIEFDLGHSGAGNVNVQFYVQASTGFNYVGDTDVAVSPGVSTYQFPLSLLMPAQQVYIRTVGFNIRDHLGEGNLIWTLEEVRSVGTPLTVRDLATHDVGTPEGGLQGAIVNFDRPAILGNDGGQNQSGLSHNPAGSGSLQWTDLGNHGVGDPSGGAVTWGNGTAWNGNSFNERLHDVSNYDFVTFRMSATDPTGAGGSVDAQAFFQTGSGFAFQSVSELQSLPIDGQFHVLRFPLADITNRNIVDWTGINLAGHPNDLVINVDRVRFVPEPASLTLLGIVGVACAGIFWRDLRKGR